MRDCNANKVEKSHKIKNEKTQQYEIKPKQQTNKHKRQRSHNRHQHNTDDDGQAMGESLRDVQMSR